MYDTIKQHLYIYTYIDVAVAHNLERNVIMEVFFSTIPKIFDKALVAKQAFVKYFVIPTGIATLPGLIVFRILYVYVFKRLMDCVWKIMCILYVFLVDLYVKMAPPPASGRSRPHSNHRMQ